MFLFSAEHRPSFCTALACNRRSVLVLCSHHNRGLAFGFLPLNFLFITFSFLFSSITYSDCVTSPSCFSELSTFHSVRPFVLFILYQWYVSLCQAICCVHLVSMTAVDLNGYIASISKSAITTSCLKPTVFYKQVEVLTLEDGTDRLFRNVGMESSLLAA
jgi:hypothetical protein